MSLIEDMGCPICVYKKIFADRAKKTQMEDPCKCGREWEKVGEKWRVKKNLKELPPGSKPAEESGPK